MEKSDSPGSAKVLALLSLPAFLGVLTVNALANALPLNGVNTGQLSDELPNLFVPAGLTFSIWGLIYALLAGYLALAIAEVFGEKKGAAWRASDGGLFLLNALANMGWIFAWHWRNIPLSLVLMLVLLGSLIALEGRIRPRLLPGGSLTGAGKFRRFFLSVPIRVYLGWICVATIANVTALFVKLGWNGLGLDPRIWTVVVILAGLGIALGFIARGGVAAPLVVVWAYAGIVLKRTKLDADYSRPVWLAAGIAALLILGAIALVRIRASRLPGAATPRPLN